MEGLCKSGNIPAGSLIAISDIYKVRDADKQTIRQGAIKPLFVSTWQPFAALCPFHSEIPRAEQLVEKPSPREIWTRQQLYVVGPVANDRKRQA
ncbi:hypothetical protein ANN_11205 [Periplaneta americana]|uniref:Per a allergen n=1 Tax=Periplaneta americana TaxID=6978 RepID=A0ABQ8T634_PERAM|nr:hypothetical protein ANN_11205 [Periplaneta americana]